jgi:hypothetical protein
MGKEAFSLAFIQKTNRTAGICDKAMKEVPVNRNNTNSKAYSKLKHRVGLPFLNSSLHVISQKGDESLPAQNPLTLYCPDKEILSNGRLETIERALKIVYMHRIPARRCAGTALTEDWGLNST